MKELKLLKTIGLIALVIFLTLSLTSNSCSRRSILDLNERLTSLSLQNDDLEKGINERENTILRIEVEKKVLREAYLKLSEQKDSLEKNEEWFKKEYWRMKAEIVRISTDSSYNWLQLVAYPFGEEKKPYAFGGLQVKAIHLDKVDYDNKVSLVGNLELQLDNCEERNDISLALVDSSEKQLVLAQGNSASKDTIIFNKDEEIGLKDGVIKKERLWKRVAIVVAAVETVLLIIL